MGLCECVGGRSVGGRSVPVPVPVASDSSVATRV